MLLDKGRLDDCDYCSPCLIDFFAFVLSPLSLAFVLSFSNGSFRCAFFLSVRVPHIHLFLCESSTSFLVAGLYSCLSGCIDDFFIGKGHFEAENAVLAS